MDYRESDSAFSTVIIGKYSTVDRQPMIEDAVMSVRCPSCGEPAEGWMMGSNHLDGEGLTEHYSCPCGCRFRVEVVPE